MSEKLAGALARFALDLHGAHVLDVVSQSEEIDDQLLAGYRSIKTDDRQTTNMWPYPVAVGSPLPSVPLALKNGLKLISGARVREAGTETEATRWEREC